MKFKYLLKEVINKTKFKKFTAECSTFIQKNYGELDRGEGVIRGTKDHGNLKKRPFRIRNEIKGIPFRYYFHEKLKPSNVPSRKEIVSAYKGQLDFDHLDHYGEKSYMVFPVGANYKLVWHPDAADFNNSDYWSYFRPMRRRIESLLEIHGTDKIEIDGETVLIPEELVYYANIEDYLSIDLYDSNSPEDIKKSYKKIELFLEKNREKLEPVFEKIDGLFGSANPYEFFEGVKKEMERYFDELKITQEISDVPVTQSEVSVYPPDGFWYVDEKVIEYVEDNYNSWIDLIKS